MAFSPHTFCFLQNVKTSLTKPSKWKFQRELRTLKAGAGKGPRPGLPWGHCGPLFQLGAGTMLIHGLLHLGIAWTGIISYRTRHCRGLLGPWMEADLGVCGG